MQTPDLVRAVPAFQFRSTQPEDIESIETIAARATRRVPAGLTTAMSDPEQRLTTIIAQNPGHPDQVIGFMRVKRKGDQLQWTDLVVDPEYLDQELKRAILAHVKLATEPKATITTLPGLMTKPWKTFVEEQAPHLGFEVEPGAKRLVLRF